jgi:hypothetical protein
MISKRAMIFGAFATIVPTAASAAKRDHAKWTVPAGVDEVNVKSWTKDGKRVMNYDFDVEPGQTFLLTTK